MNFTFQLEAQKANERFVGLSCEQQSHMTLEELCDVVKPVKRTSRRSITPRGSIYLQLRRIVTMGEIRHQTKNR